jgi:copper chaperone
MMDDGTIPASRLAAAPKVSMIALHVPDMTCGHCVGTVTKAVQAVDRTAQIRIDLDRHRVEIEPSPGADSQRLVEAIREAGYTPEPV